MSRWIVCGIDGSKESLAAAVVAARLAERLDASLELAYVEPPGGALSGQQSQGTRHLRRPDDRARRVLERIERGVPELEVDSRVLTGEPDDELIELASKLGAAVLVVGSRGLGAVKGALQGSVSSSLMKRSERPVVVVPPGAAGEERAGAACSTVVCGVDRSDAAPGVAHVAAALAAALGLELVLAHAYSAALPDPVPGPHGVAALDYEEFVARERDSARRLLEGVARETETHCPTRLRTEAASPVPALERCAEDEDAELIVVGTDGRGALASALLGSTSAELAGSARTPVVVVPRGAVVNMDAAPSRAGERERS